MTWQQSAETLIREIEPDLSGVPLYLCDADEVGEHEPRLVDRDDALGYTSPALDEMLADWLRSRGRWQGRGVGVIVFSDRHQSRQHLLGTVLHEVAHAVESGIPSATDPDEQSVFQHLESMLKLRGYFRRQVSSEPHPPWFMHGADFVRCCCHLAFRANQAIESIRPHHLSFASNYHSPPFNSELVWMTALRDELHERDGEPIGTILQSDPPTAFVERWQMATGWFDQAAIT